MPQSRTVLIKRFLIGGGIVLAFALLVYAFSPDPLGVDLGEVAKGPMEVTVDDEGETRVKEKYVVSAPVTGRIQRIVIDAGDQVRAKETVLVTILPSDPNFLDARAAAQAEARLQAAQAAKALADAEEARARAELDYAAKDLDRARRLAADGTIPEKALDRAESDAKIRAAEWQRAKSNVRVATFDLAAAEAALLGPGRENGRADAGCCVAVRSPVDGAVLRLRHESETVVAAGEPLLEIGDPSAIEIVVDLLSTDAVKLAPGAKAYIEHWGGPDALLARVRLIEPSGFTKISALGIEEQRVNVILDLEGDPTQWRNLGDGFRVEARIVIWAEEEVVRAPLAALFRDAKGWAAFVEADGRAKRRDVKIGSRNDMEAEILDGLAPGEKVILHPSAALADGVRIYER